MRKITQNIRREQRKIVVNASTSILNKIKVYTNSQNNFYLGFGGTGDAILLLANCWNDKSAKVVFFANNLNFANEFFSLFKIPVFLQNNLMGTPIASEIYNYMTNLPRFKTSAHLADQLYHGDWINEEKYISRITKYVPWITHLGQERHSKPVCIIAPCGSNMDQHRQRYLNKEEYETLVNKYLDLNYTVYATGSINNFKDYGVVGRENFYWLSSERIYKWDGSTDGCNLRKMLRIINAADKVISVDTYLKTYSALVGIPTTVIKTRWDGEYKQYGEDVSDLIFLNKKIWPKMELVKFEELL